MAVYENAHGKMDRDQVLDATDKGGVDLDPPIPGNAGAVPTAWLSRGKAPWVRTDDVGPPNSQATWNAIVGQPSVASPAGFVTDT